jgi:hypothetical protein
MTDLGGLGYGVSLGFGINATGEAVDRSWHFPYDDTWMAEVVAEQIDGAGILLLGRAPTRSSWGPGRSGATRCRWPPGSTQCRSWWSRPC